MTLYRFAALGLALLPLAGCNSAKVNFCPVPVILADASQLAVFRQGATQDLSGEAYRVSLVGTNTDCQIDKKTGETDSSLTLTFRATRAPLADGAHYTVPYFVAVTRGDQLLEKRILSISFDFAPGAAVASFQVSPDDFNIKLESGHQPYEYQLMAGFQMTPAQVDYNKRVGRFAP
ncbi:MAG TPA: hypothetical protein VGM68_09450 [Rhizomicrobium sp.]|jgi:hypothetical protein